MWDWEPAASQQQQSPLLRSCYLRYLIHIKINRLFFNPTCFDVCTAVADQIHTSPDLSAHAVWLSAQYMSHTARLWRCSDRWKGKHRVWLHPTLSRIALCMQSAAVVFISHARSLAVEYLCNRTQGWSSSNHGRIIKTCWSLQSWKRGRFINDTLTTAFGL